MAFRFRLTLRGERAIQAARQSTDCGAPYPKGPGACDLPKGHPGPHGFTSWALATTAVWADPMDCPHRFAVRVAADLYHCPACESPLRPKVTA